MAVLSLKINLKIQIMKHNGIIITTLQDSNNIKNTKNTKNTKVGIVRIELTLPPRNSRK